MSGRWKLVAGATLDAAMQATGAVRCGARGTGCRARMAREATYRGAVWSLEEGMARASASRGAEPGRGGNVWC